jgi:hypothetical protein
MNIELSAKEYRDLLDILHIADVVLSGHRREPDPRSERHIKLIQKLYALARVEGLGLLIRQEAVTGVSVPAPEFEASTLAHVAINEFGDHLFWDELISRLSMRDAARMAGGLERLNALNDSDRHNVDGPIRQHYIEEFSKNGLENLVIIEGYSNIEKVPVQTSD